MRRVVRVLLIAALALAVVLVALALLAPPAPEFAFFEGDRPMVIAHHA